MIFKSGIKQVKLTTTAEGLTTTATTTVTASTATASTTTATWGALGIVGALDEGLTIANVDIVFGDYNLRLT